MSLRAAMTAILWDPAGLLAMIFYIRWAQRADWGVLPLLVVPLGYFGIILGKAIQGDLFPFPGVRATWRAGSLGCMTWLLLFLSFVLCVLGSMALTLVFGQTEVGLPLFEFGAQQLRNPLFYITWLGTVWTMLCTLVGASAASREFVWSRFSEYWSLATGTTWRMLFHRPDLLSLVKLLVLSGLFLASFQIVGAGGYELSVFVTAIPVVLGALLAHCLGQWARRVTGKDSA